MVPAFVTKERISSHGSILPNTVFISILSSAVSVLSADKNGSTISKVRRDFFSFDNPPVNMV